MHHVESGRHWSVTLRAFELRTEDDIAEPQATQGSSKKAGWMLRGVDSAAAETS